jgi:hypothetical protein
MRGRLMSDYEVTLVNDNSATAYSFCCELANSFCSVRPTTSPRITAPSQLC